MFLALILVEECTASKILIANGVTPAQVKDATSNTAPPEAGPVLVPRMKPTGTHSDLTLEARDGKLSPLIGRERELESIVRILSRRDRCNPVLIGEPGVGKDALVRGLAQKIADGDVSAKLDGRPVLAIEGSALKTSHLAAKATRSSTFTVSSICLKAATSGTLSKRTFRAADCSASRRAPPRDIA